MLFDYDSGGITHRNRIRSYGSDDLRVDVWNGFLSQWDSKWKFSGSGHESYENITITKSTPKLTFDNTSGTDFSLELASSVLSVKGGSTTVAQSDGTYFYGNGGLAAGSTSSGDVIRWKRFSGLLGAAGPATATFNVTNGSTQKVLGALVMLTTSTNDQGDNTYQVYDWLSTASAGNKDFHFEINRFSANDQLVISYGSSYGASSIYKALVFYEP